MVHHEVAGPASEAIDGLYADRLIAGGPGGVVAVVHRGEVAHLAGYGLANVEFGIGWDSRTRYPLASITKTFVALLVLGMADRGYWSLHDPVVEHAPELALPESITLANLLNMASGLRHDEVTAELLGAGADTRNELLRSLTLRLPELQFAPGRFQTYCCANFRLLSHVIERVREKTFAAVLATDILELLGMSDTTAPEDWAAVEPGRASVYERHREGEWRHACVIGQSAGDGAVVSSLRDMLKFCVFLTRRDAQGSSPIERLAAGAPSLDGLTARYGFGLVIDEWRGRVVWGHSGVTNTKLAFWPEDDLAIVCLHNDLGLNADDMVFAIADCVLGDAGQNRGSLEALQSRFGWYADQQSGMVLELLEAGGEPAIRLFGDRPAALAARGDGVFETVRRMSPTRLTLATDGSTLLDEIAPGLRCTRIGGGMPPQSDQAGLYLCRAGGVATVGWEDAEGAPRLILRLGAGVEAANLLRLSWAGGDLFHADGTAVHFRRSHNGGIEALELSRQRARRIRFERVADVEARPNAADWRLLDLAGDEADVARR